MCSVDEPPPAPPSSLDKDATTTTESPTTQQQRVQPSWAAFKQFMIMVTPISFLQHIYLENISEIRDKKLYIFLAFSALEFFQYHTVFNI
jgi:hypothetical protein